MMPNLRPRSDRGQATILVVGVAVLCMAVAGVTIDGTRLMLQRRQLQNAADSAALAGASALDRSAYYRSDGKVVRLDSSEAKALATAMLGGLPRDTRALVTVSPDQVGVALTTRIPTTFLGLVGIGSLQLNVESEAEPVAGST